MNQTHTPIDVTPDQRANLQRLADYLLTTIVDDFDMEEFRQTDTSKLVELASYDPHQTCGTVGCAIGHGPDAGIAPLVGEGWHIYAARAFGASIAQHQNVVSGPLYEWCFDASWTGTDNTPQGAARRIQIALTKGIPDNCLEQQRGSAPLSYTP